MGQEQTGGTLPSHCPAFRPRAFPFRRDFSLAKRRRQLYHFLAPSDAVLVWPADPCAIRCWNLLTDSPSSD